MSRAGALAALTVFALGLAALVSGYGSGAPPSPSAATAPVSATTAPAAAAGPDLSTGATAASQPAADPKAKGSLTAPVVIEEWGDFQ